MQRSTAEILESSVQARDAEEITAARLACERIAERVRYVDSSEAGRIVSCAERAEEALFDLLNVASSFGGCQEASRAIEERRSR